VRVPSQCSSGVGADLETVLWLYDSYTLTLPGTLYPQLAAKLIFQLKIYTVISYLETIHIINSIFFFS
jgi:hypothetical protein